MEKETQGEKGFFPNGDGIEEQKSSQKGEQCVGVRRFMVRKVKIRNEIDLFSIQLLLLKS